MKKEHIRIRRSNERGFEDFGWTDNWMTFSFAGYHNPEWMHFGPIRVIVENHIQPHKGFTSHPHRDMEIVTYVSSGVLTHGDNMGHKENIRSGEMQRITAGKGIVHSEMNEQDEVEHNIQIWILPDRAGYTPGYQMKRYNREERTGALRLYISRDGRDDSMEINQDVDLYAGIFPSGSKAIHRIEQGRGVWMQIIHGKLDINGEIELGEGDGAGFDHLDKLEWQAQEDTELILFDVAMDFETPYRLP